MNSRTFILHPSTLIPALVGVLVLLFVTAQGIGVSPDSTVYIGAARSVVRGEGLKALSGKSIEPEPLTHYPPLYPLLLALCGEATGADPLGAARWLNAFIFGGNILLAALAVGLYAQGRGRVAALVASLLMLAAPDMLQVHSMAWSEPLFMLLILASLMLLAAYLERGRRWLLMAAAVACAMALLTRYAGAVLLATGACGALLLSRKSYGRRVWDGLLFACVGALPLVLWAVRNRSRAGGATDRELVFHPVGLRQLGGAVSTVSTWLPSGKAGGSLRGVLLLAEAGCVVAAVCVLWRRNRAAERWRETRMKRSLAEGLESAGREGDYLTMSKKGRASLKLKRWREALEPLRTQRLTGLLVIFIILYFGFFIFTASFIDFDTVFDERALAPVHALAVVLSICAGWRLLGAWERGRVGSLLAAALCVAFVCSYGLRGAGWVKEKRGDGQGYTSRAWRESPAMERVRALPAHTLIYTNGYDAVYFLTGRPALFLPEKIVHGTGRANALFARELAQVNEQLTKGDAVLVYFKGFPERAYLPSEDELREQLDLRALATETDGTIYAK